MSRHFSRVALPIIVFAALAALIGSQQSSGQPSNPYGYPGYPGSSYNPYPGGYPTTQAIMDKSPMSYYGDGQGRFPRKLRGLGERANKASVDLNNRNHPLVIDTIDTLNAQAGSILHDTTSVAQDDEKLREAFSGKTLSLGAGGLQQNGTSTTILPELTFSNGLTGFDLGFQEYSGNAPGYGLSAKYCPGPLRERYSQKLDNLYGPEPKKHGYETEYHAWADKLQDDLKTLQDDLKITKRQLKEADINTLSSDYHALALALNDAAQQKDDLIRAIVDYSTGVQTSVYSVGRFFNDAGWFTAEGAAVGRLMPLKAVGLGRAALTPSVLAQAVQFSSRNSGIPSGTDAQYGISLVLQDAANGFEPGSTPATPATPVIHPWHAKIGYEYYSKAFGGMLATPDSHDFFLRLRTVGPTPVEIKPYIGWAGQGHKQYKGVEVGITFPVSF